MPSEHHIGREAVALSEGPRGGVDRRRRPRVNARAGGDNLCVDPLSDLDGVDWASLHGTYRSADDVPRQIAASANLALAHVNVSPTAALERMTSLLDHQSLAVRITASIALAYRLGPDLPDEALDTLIDAKAAEALPDFPLGWHERAQRGYVALALHHLGLG